MKKESVVERILAKVVGTEMSAQELERVSGGMKYECTEWCEQWPSTSQICDHWEPV